MIGNCPSKLKIYRTFDVICCSNDSSLLDLREMLHFKKLLVGSGSASASGGKQSYSKEFQYVQNLHDG